MDQSKNNNITTPTDTATDDPMAEAKRVDALADYHHSTEQSARENAGNTRRPDDGHPSDLGVSDTPNARPDRDPSQKGPYDPSHRGSTKIQGEDVPTTGTGSERRNEETHL